jgi:hypothetical protein
VKKHAGVILKSELDERVTKSLSQNYPPVYSYAA